MHISSLNFYIATKRVVIALILLSLLSLNCEGQECSASQFSVKRNGEEYLTINSPTEVKTCGGVNICSALSEAKQTLILTSEGSLQISEGNSVTLPDLSSTNEIQNLGLNSAGELSISGGNSVTLPDYSSTNEIQSLNLNSGGQLSISGGNSITLPDPSSTNEIQNLGLTAAGELSISGGNSVTLPDPSSTNEIQNLGLNSAGELSISAGNSVTLPDTSSTNEIQNLGLNSAGLLSISGGNSVQIPDTSNTNELQDLSTASGGSQINLSQSNSSVSINQLACSSGASTLCDRVTGLEATVSSIQTTSLGVLYLKPDQNVGVGRINTWSKEVVRGNISVNTGISYMLLNGPGLYQVGIHMPGYTASNGLFRGVVGDDGIANFMYWSVYAPAGTFVTGSSTSFYRITTRSGLIFVTINDGYTVGNIPMLWAYKVSD